MTNSSAPMATSLTLARLFRAALVAMGACLVVAQVLVVVAGAEFREAYPEVARLITPYSIAFCLAILCAAVALVMVWLLFEAFQRHEFIARRSLRLATAASAATAVQTLLFVGLWVHLILIEQTGSPVVFFALSGAVLGSAVLLLVALMVRDGTAKALGATEANDGLRADR